MLRCPSGTAAIAIASSLTEASRREFRLARLSAGLSRVDVARAVGVSASQVDRYERGLVKDLRFEQVCRLSLAVGLVPSLRFFPTGDPFRDAAQVRVLERLRVRIAATARVRSEVPLPGHRDLRAWDAVLDQHGCVDAFEIETRLSDLQATERRILLELCDDPSVRHVFFVVADTRANRLALAAGREALRGDFPLDTRVALGSLGPGSCPGENGVIVL